MLKYVIVYLIICGVVLVWLCADHFYYEQKKPNLSRSEIEARIKRAYNNADNADKRDQREYFLDVAGYWEHELSKLDKLNHSV